MLRFLFLALWAWAAVAQAQIGGRYAHEFLRLSPSARMTALGGAVVAVKDRDLNLGLYNPAALDSSMHRQATFQQTVYVAGLSYGQVGYAHRLPIAQPIVVQASLQYLSYGRFTRTNAEGQILQEDFGRLGDYAFVLGGSYQLYERLSLGMNTKFVLGYLADRTAAALAFDAAAMYRDTSRNLVVSLLLRNMGGQLKSYGEAREPIPFEVQLGISHRLRHLPLRLSAIGQQLQRWSIRYDDPNAQAINNNLLATPQTTSKFGAFVDNFFRHFIFNAEFLFGKREVFHLRLGYNHLRGAELRVAGLRGLSGFSAGFGLNLPKLRVDYGFGSYHFSGALHHFGLSVFF
jgi:hypothetical protein